MRTCNAGVENHLQRNRVHHRLRIARVGPSSSTLVVQPGRGNGHSQALAWGTAGWETAEVNMDAETLLLRRKPAVTDHSLTLDEAWPVHSAGGWPEDLSLRREDIYAERI